MNNNIIPICFALDEGYIMPTVVAIKSLLDNYNSNKRVHLMLLVPETFDDEKCNIIKTLCSIDYVYRFEIIHVKEKIFDDKAHLGHITYPTYYRLIMDEYINYDKCIYLDGDILVLGNIAELYEYNVDGFYIAGVKSPYMHIKKRDKDQHRNNLGIESFSLYVNAGVLLFNLDKIRKERMHNTFVKLLDRQFRLQDQDILNCACYPKILIVPNKYNVMVENYTYSKTTLRKEYADSVIEEARKNPIIYHFASKYKPWKYRGCIYEKEWQTVYESVFSAPLKKRNYYTSFIHDYIVRVRKRLLHR